jgi:large-conductance mechanosensitive channel
LGYLCKIKSAIKQKEKMVSFNIILTIIAKIIIFVSCIYICHSVFYKFKEIFKKEKTNLEHIKTEKYKNILKEIKDNLTTPVQTNNNDNKEDITDEKKELMEFMEKIEIS